ncbi:synaptotagmin-12-like isoform X2 [Periplaneta americana]|uniref:synaptotagmin-12-like isoform X2 n=1 Tax=Periplaneta americana TaxID=6978 RepID=UPI0037E99AC2
MSEVKVAITLLGVVAIILLVLLALCRFMGLWTWTTAWIFSSREEKVGLTRATGHYNANGYLVHSDSDIHLDATGSFKRFDPVDRDFRVAITTSSLMGGYGGSPPPSATLPAAIPPQPLRPAPAPAPMRPAPAPPPPPPPQRAPEPEPLLADVTTGDAVTAAIVPAEDPESGEQLPPTLQRAMSCDSVCSDTSVVLGDLEEPNVTGYLCVGLEYDSDSADLVVSVLEAKDLVGGTDNSSSLDTYVRVYLLPDKTTNMQTRVYRKTNCPSYKEKFLFGLEASEFTKRSLTFYVYASDKFSNTLIGEAELKLCDVTPRQPVTTWLTLTDTGQRGTQFGELMFSLSYLPTAERLTVVIVKARNLRFPQGRDSGDPFVKVYLLQHGKKVHKKKTSTKKGERSPIFNEAMIFSVPAHTLQTIQLRVTVAENTGEPRAYSIGHVIVGTQASGKALSHWNQMLSSLRKPIAMWHPLRK